MTLCGTGIGFGHNPAAVPFGMNRSRRYKLKNYFRKFCHNHAIAESNKTGGVKMKQFDSEKQMIAKAVSGDQEALETLLSGVQDMILSLRMRGMPPDATFAHLDRWRQEITGGELIH